MSPYCELNDIYCYRPPASLRRLCCYTSLSVILFTGGGGGIPACLAGGIPTGFRGEAVYPSMPCRFPGPHPRESLRHLVGEGGSPGPHPGGSWGVWSGGGLQAHTQGGRLRGLTGGSPDPHLGGFSRPTPGRGSPGPHLGGLSRPTLRQTPLTATAVGSMYSSGMHSCS